MRVIARRSNTNLYVYGGIFLFGIAIIVMSVMFLGGDFLCILGGIIIMTICAVICKSILDLPKELITADENDKLTLHFCDKSIAPSKLTAINYHRAGHQGLPYRWGTLTISSNTGDFECMYVDNVVEVAEELTRLMYKYNKDKSN